MITQPGRYPLTRTDPSAAGWTLALCWIFLLAGLPAVGWPWWTVAGVGLVAGRLSGLSVGLVTGVWLPRLRPAAPAEVGPQVPVGRAVGP
jgi:hypothetical protein